jgi:hypothetical protein
MPVCRRREPAQTRAPFEVTHSRLIRYSRSWSYSSGNGLCMGRCVVPWMPGERVVERVKFTAFVYIRPEFVVTANSRIRGRPLTFTRIVLFRTVYLTPVGG